jgi:hypothetical protein
MASLKRKEPLAYADQVRAFFEIELEGEATALTAAQSSSLGKMLQEMGQAIARIPSVPAGPWLLKELELEGETMTRVRDLLTEAQRTRLTRGDLNGLVDSELLASMSILPMKDGADEVVRVWEGQYKLGAAQLPQARAVAQDYVDALLRLEAWVSKAFSFETPENGGWLQYDARVASLRAQIASLDLLLASMTPAQQDLVSIRQMHEFTLDDHPREKDK